MYISDYIKCPLKGHQNFDFVDAYIDGDNRLFIDPCLIDMAEDTWGRNASKIIRAFFDCMYDGFKNDTLQPEMLFAHAGEQNATKLGYGNGQNGKGKTAQGLFDSLYGLSTLVKKIPTISCPQDVPIFVEGFAEDCMSDLLTNILHEQLNAFTIEQMSKWNCPPNGKKAIWTFDAKSSKWVQIVRPCWLYKGRELLLVPKSIVRKNYLFKAHQYLYSVIADRIRKDNGWYDLRKIDVWLNLPRKSFHWEYTTVIDYTKENPEALSEYHKQIPRFYSRANGRMSDRDLDCAVYGGPIAEIA